MTIYLPESVNSFRQAFNTECDRILSSEDDEVFCSLFVQLAQSLQINPLLKDYVFKLEDESAKRKQEFNIAALEALEDSFARLWKYHRHALKYRKQLVHTKKIISEPNGFESLPAYERVLFSLGLFREFSPFCKFIRSGVRLFREIQSQLRVASIQFDYLCRPKGEYFSKRKVYPLKLLKKDQKLKLHRLIYNHRSNRSVPFLRSTERVPEALFSPKIAQVKKRFSIPGQNDYEKRKNMHIMAETTPAFCWEKIQFLCQWCAPSEASSRPKHFKGRWRLIREKAWQYAQKKCEIETIQCGKMLPGDFSAIEYQVNRSDYEKYLKSLKNHIHSYLFTIEDKEQKPEDNPLLYPPGTQREAFVRDLARKFWKAEPLGKRDAAFNYYRTCCPLSKQLKKGRWEQIIRKQELDPRPKEAKTRGAGKKTYKN